MFFPELKDEISIDSFDKINSYFETIEKNKEKFPFLKNYVNKNKVELPKKNSFIDLLKINSDDPNFYLYLINFLKMDSDEINYDLN